MKEQFIPLIARHLTYMKAVEKSSLDIFKSAMQGEFGIMVAESKNRARLINILQDLQTSIEDMLEDTENCKGAETLDILLKWNNDVSLWVEKINKIDQQIIDFLQGQKEKTIQEIAHIFKNRQALKGYNLGNTK